ncbi:MAG: NRDE family protein [Gammaproteobacteria bacterium]|nr:NRDE family protein [Gammaproteobacteria bacterium]
MCLLVLAWMKHPRYRLVVAANRDEFHDRPAAPLGWWNDDARVLGGRDLRAGGTWLGLTRDGRFGVVTNYRDLEAAPAADSPSRGRLVPEFLAGDSAPGSFVRRLNGSASSYAGFNLLVGGPDALHYFSNRDAGGPRELAPGIYGLSNHLLDSPWPKLVRTRERFAALLAADDVDATALFDLLADRERAGPAGLPDTGLSPEWERVLSSPFVVNERYGTRCSTVLLLGQDARTVVHERRFDATGRQTGATRFEFAGADARG